MPESDAPKLDESAIRAQAENVTEADLQAVIERADEIEKRFAKRGPLRDFLDEILLCLKLLRDFTLRRYITAPFWVIGALVVMFLYVLNPIDLVPDYIIGLGQIDDLTVVAICIAMVRKELERYKIWLDESAVDEAK